MTKEEAEIVSEAIIRLETGQPNTALGLLRHLLRKAGHEAPPPVLVSTRDAPANAKPQP